jgi:exosortase
MHTSEPTTRETSTDRAVPGHLGFLRHWHSPVPERLAVIFGLCLAVAVVYWPSSVALDAIWRGANGEAYTHGYVVLLVCLWLVVRDRARLAELSIRPAPKALVLVLLLSVAWIWFWRAAVQELQVALLPALGLAAVAAALGWRTARRLVFPAGFLYFAMPIWGPVNDWLQALSVKANGTLIWLAGIPAYMKGDFIELPAGTIQIAGGCSGLHAFIVGTALAALYGELRSDSLRRRTVWVGLMGALALIDNWVRIFAVTDAAYASDMHSSLVKNHYWLGWYLFAATFLGFLWLAGRLGDRWDRSLPTEAHRTPTPESPDRAAPSRLGVAIALACLAALPALSYGMDAGRAHARTDLAFVWPAAPAGWSGPQPVISGDWAPTYADPTVESFRRYVEAGGPGVEIFAVAYRTQSQRAKLLDYSNSLLGRAALLQAVSQRIVDSPQGRWRETLAADAGGMRSLVWSRYRIGDRSFVRGRLSQLWYGWEALVGSPVSSLIALRAVCEPGCAAARARLAAAAAELQPTLRRETQRKGESP